MKPKRKKIVRFGKMLLVVIGLFLLCIILLSMSPRNAVRLRVLHDGHPIIALKCDPRYDKDYSHYLGKTVYSISSKDRYLSPNGNFTVTMYKIHRHSFLYTATAQPDIVK